MTAFALPSPVWHAGCW